MFALTNSRTAKFPKWASEFLRFLPIGGAAAVVSLFVYSLLLSGGLQTAPAKGLGFTAGAAVSFFGNRRFTFRQQPNVSARVGVFCILYLGSLSLNVTVNEIVLYLLVERTVPSLAAGWFVATAASASANFVGMKLLVFSGHRRETRVRNLDSLRSDKA